MKTLLILYFIITLALSVSLPQGVPFDFPGTGLALLGPIIPYIAVVSAGSANVGFTRMGEITDGVVIKDKDGKELGVSKNAGKQAVFQTIVTRSAALPISILLVPPAVMNALKMPPGPVTTAIELSVITVCVAVGLPFCLALAPQQMTIPVSKLEPQFQNLVSGTGEKITEVFANKGL